jgi:two-component system chemotaxis response regulator CheY
MSTTQIASAEASKSGARDANSVERRRRKRAKISAQVHVSAANAPQPFEEICKSVDVSRDGLLFMTARAGYWKGQRLDVTFPYSTAAAALNQPQSAEVVRVEDRGNGQHGVGVQFVTAKQDAAVKGAEAVSGSTSGAVGAQAKQQSIVLAVEADRRTADTMRNILQNDGYTVVIVSTAQAALEVLRTTVPAVFLAEVEAEDMSGQDLCLIIKRNDRLRGVPVILLTRAAQPADYAASHSLGAVVCMAKPFKPEKLLHVVRLVAPPPQVKNVYGSRMQANAIERAL